MTLAMARNSNRRHRLIYSPSARSAPHGARANLAAVIGNAAIGAKEDVFIMPRLDRAIVSYTVGA